MAVLTVNALKFFASLIDAAGQAASVGGDTIPSAENIVALCRNTSGVTRTLTIKEPGDPAPTAIPGYGDVVLADQSIPILTGDEAIIRSPRGWADPTTNRFAVSYDDEGGLEWFIYQLTPGEN